MVNLSSGFGGFCKGGGGEKVVFIGGCSLLDLFSRFCYESPSSFKLKYL